MKLYAHQKQIIDDAPKKIGLFLGTGSGKTRIALLLARGKTLVICPKTQREDHNWERELEGIKNPHRISLRVVSKEEFRRDATSLPRFDTVIVDEAHTCLGVTPNTRQRKRIPIPKASQLFEALNWYVQFHKPERIYLCTATIIKSPMTVWGAGKILGKIVDTMDSFRAFRSKYYTLLPMPGREVYSPKHDSDTKESLARLVRKLGYTGRLEDYFDVPDQTYRTISIPLTMVQTLRIRQLPLEYPDPLVLIGKKHQVENGVLSGDEFKKAELFDNYKIDKILELMDEFPRVIIFAKYIAQIAAIENALRKAKKPVLTLTGATKDRQNAFKEAKKRLNCAFICQAQISAGWELPEYPVMIFASMSYSFVDRVQAEGRIQRANHIKKNLYIDLVVKGGIDEAVQKAIHNKKDFDERIYAKI